MSALLAPAWPAAARVPAGFVGVTADGPVLKPADRLARELGVMKRTGVQSVRTTFLWSAAQPYASFEDVPPGDERHYSDVGGVPTDFRATDRFVLRAAKQGLRVLPVVMFAPWWALSDHSNPASRPSKFGAYARFVGALAKRYGSKGTFWASHPSLKRMPIRDWQVWNEPNIRNYWSQPFAHSYVKLLRATRPALRRADPRSRVILAGLINESWRALTAIYKAGGRRYFDVAALHPYTAKVNGLTKLLAYARDRMRKAGDARKPIAITEMSWPSAKGKVDSDVFDGGVTESQQARRVTAAYKLLAKNRRHFRIWGVYWYTWLTKDKGHGYFDYSGLRKMTRDGPRPKPAFRAFRSVVRRIRQA